MEKYVFFVVLLFLFACAVEHYDEKRSRRLAVSDEQAGAEEIPREIEEVIKRNLGEVKRCYNNVLNYDESLQGKIVAGFVITPVGKVSKTEIKSSKFGNIDSRDEKAKKKLEECLLKKISKFEFSKRQDGGIVQVYYPFVFKVKK